MNQPNTHAPEADEEPQTKTVFYGVGFCDDVIKGPYDTEQGVMGNKYFLLNHDMWPVAVIKLTLPAATEFKIEAFMTMRDESLLEDGEE